MESIVQHLTKQVTPQSLSYKALDYDEPLSFRDWKNSRTGVIPTQEYTLYNQYLTEWYAQKIKINNNDEQVYQTKLSYLSLLKELQLFFSNDEKNKWYEIVNFNDNSQVINAIPYFAKKLKEVALYYINVRKKLKNTKLQYNLGGTNTGFELEIQEQILSNYAKSDFNTLQIPNSFVNSIPDLEEIKKSLVVKVEEIYDDHEYQDQDINVPLEKYYNIHDELTTEFLHTKNVQLSDNTWIYSNTPLLSGDYFDSEYSLNLAETFLAKYSGANKSTGEYAEVSTNSSIYNIPLKEGDNVFVWPYGTYKSAAAPTTRFQPISLSANDITTLGTPGESPQTSDVLFVQTKSNLRGAWLNFQKYKSEEQTLEAKFFKNTKTEFRFPYPGFGLSGVGMEWTGPSFVYLPEFNFLKDEHKKLTENAYWNLEPSLSAVTPIKLQNTTLINQRAHASSEYTAADKIVVRDNPPYNTEPSYNGETKKAWLYKFTKTDLPIKPSGETVIFWPYERIEDNTLPSYYPVTNFICNPTKITDIKLTHETAASTFESADKIYKLKSVEDTIDNATECAWLSSSSVLYTYSKVIASPQPGISFIADTGAAVKFIWQGENLTDINDVFKPVRHRKDCPYIWDKNNINFYNFDKCTCNATKFTPFGHNGTNFDSDTNGTDIIVECTDLSDVNTVDVTKWKDFDGLNYKQSLNFAWFKTNSKKGFEEGSWVTEIPNGVPRLKKGGVYYYARAKADMPQAGTSSLPSFVFRYKYPFVTDTFTWVSASKQSDNTWKSDDVPSSMVFREKDVLLYSRTSSHIAAVSGTTTETQTIAENQRNIWANYDYVSIANPSDPTTYITQTIYVNYPELNFVDALSASIALGNGVPPINKRDVLAIKRWYLIDPSGTRRQFEDTEVLSFTPAIPGIYRVEVEVLSGKPEMITSTVNPNTVFSTSPTATPVVFDVATYTYKWSPASTITYLFTGIPPITAVDFQRQVTSLTSVVTPLPGFVYNVDLYGWDYSTAYQQTVKTPGARPFWGESYTGRSEQNKYGSVPDWGKPYRVYDEHNIITQPVFSDIELQTGQYIEYERKGGSTLTWLQPLIQNIEINKNVWCDLDINFDDEAKFENILTDNPNTLTVVPLTTETDLTLTNVVDNYPVTVLYKAVTPFTWSVTAVPEIEEYTLSESKITTTVTPERPWNQFTNRFNPTSLLVPTLESIYTKKDSGGYFTPNNLGVSLYNSKDFTYTLNTSSTQITSTFTPPDFFFGGRGNTKIDNLIPYTSLLEDASWLKESYNSGVLAGNIDREVAKTYQKFVPYQSSTESKITKQTGINVINKKLSPWEGRESNVWGDKEITQANEKNIHNTNSWIEQHILQSGEKRIYSWSSDIYGNQYILLKDIKDVMLYEQKDITGELWVQKTSKTVQPASLALEQVFDTYKGLSLYSELTGNGIKKIDVFFDTLYIETTGAILLEKLNYDYSNDTIYSFVDSSHTISLLYPVTIGLTREYTNPGLTGICVAQVGDTWFLPEQKIVLLSICELSAKNLTPQLFELDISNEKFSKVFPI